MAMMMHYGKWIILDGQLYWGNTHEEIVCILLGDKRTLNLFLTVDDFRHKGKEKTDPTLLPKSFVAGSLLNDDTVEVQAWTLIGDLTQDDVRNILRANGYEDIIFLDQPHPLISSHGRKKTSLY